MYSCFVEHEKYSLEIFELSKLREQSIKPKLEDIFIAFSNRESASEPNPKTLMSCFAHSCLIKLNLERGKNINQVKVFSNRRKR